MAKNDVYTYTHDLLLFKQENVLVLYCLKKKKMREIINLHRLLLTVKEVLSDS